jgi:two-component system, NtrC family, sensor kinase
MAMKELARWEQFMNESNWYEFGVGEETKSIPSPEMNAQPVQVPQVSIQAGPQGKRVLIVDDDNVFLKLTARKLQSAGFQVRTARESSEAIAALSEEPADAILLDVYFPPDVGNGGMGSWDGFQLMTWLRGNLAVRDARFIMVSSSNSASDRQRAQQLGAVAWLQKPLNFDELVAVVNSQN